MDTCAGTLILRDVQGSGQLYAHDFTPKIHESARISSAERKSLVTGAAETVEIPTYRRLEFKAPCTATDEISLELHTQSKELWRKDAPLLSYPVSRPRSSLGAPTRTTGGENRPPTGAAAVGVPLDPPTPAP